MIAGRIFVRLTAVLVFVNMCHSQEVNADTKKEKKPLKYPLQVHKMYWDRISKKVPRSIGAWSSWSEWSPCTRSCGGGVTQQTRHCVNRPADSRFVRRQRRRRQNGRQAIGCVGLYKRFHLCNSQECPSEVDFRFEQCSAFNSRLLKGKQYTWEPFLKVKDECALNCRAVGMKFFATLNKTVIDGTSCNYPTTYTGKSAPKGTRGVCIGGECKSVNSRGVIGSLDDNQEECAACLKGSCRSVNGIYTRPDLPPGYSLVAQVPSGACRIFIQQLKRTRNFLALKFSNNETFIINGDWKLSNSKIVQVAGTKFVYVRQDDNSLETLSSPGPLAANIDIMIVNYEANPGIKYGYSLPVDESPILAPPLIKRPSNIEPSLETKRLDSAAFNISSNQRDEPKPPVLYPGHRRTRQRRKYHHWKITGLTACSKSCGGGIQTYVRTCFKEVHPHNPTPVNERRCAHLEPPANNPIRCNMEPCPPAWESYWSDCSVSCGEGVKQYVSQCKQELATGSVVLSDGKCPKFKPANDVKPCRETSCDITNNELPQVEDKRKKDWSKGHWSACSVTCGTGHKTRSVTCPSGQCRPERPAHAEYCNAGPCSLLPPLSSSSKTHSSSWLLTDWSKCSEACGTGTQTRLAVCLNQNCPDESKPELSRACSSDKQCDGQWFTGPWGSCSESCIDRARKRREVLCVIKIRGQSHITNEMTCAAHSKPDEEQPCDGFCPPHWFAGEWGNCEGSCPVGVQTREVKCLDHYGRLVDGCPEEELPLGKRTCACENRSENNPDRYKPAQDEPADRSCVDRIRKCKLAVQARLCHYHYYITHCCESCKRSQQDLLE